MLPRVIFLLAGLAGALGVAMGAAASHGLESSMTAQAIGWVDTASRYLLWHAPILALCGILILRTGSRLFALSAGLHALGLTLFSGMLLVRAFWGIDSLSFLIPIGGSGLILGWVFFALAGLRADFSRKS